MKQPLYKFGDTLQEAAGTTFTVGTIFFDINCFFYGKDRQSLCFNEDQLRIYTEPARLKKVYQFVYKYKDSSPILTQDLYDNDTDFRSTLSFIDLEYIRLANTFEVPE